MRTLSLHRLLTLRMQTWLRLTAGLLLALPCMGCVMVGYRSGGGWFVWPGGFGLILLILVVLLLVRRR